MLLSVIASLALAAPDLPAVCAPPPVREVGALTTLAQRSGALSVGLDSVATWCFDSSGTWTGGVTQKQGRAADAEPTGDCARAVESCEKARADITPELRGLLEDSLKDLARPYLGARYVPRRSGLSERPSESAECRSRTRSALFAQAQARMDVARLASQAQNEYANYRTWLFSEGLKCADAVARGVRDPTNKGISVDAPVQVDAGSQRVAVAVDGEARDPARAPAAAPAVGASGAPESATADAGGASTVALRPTTPSEGSGVEPQAQAGGTRDGLLMPAERPAEVSLLEKWRAFSAERARLEADLDWGSGFLVSRELRDCKCTRVDPTLFAKKLEAGEALSSVDEARASRCEACLQDSFPGWKARVKKQCALMEQLTDFEMGVLERSDDGNGLPARCFALARARRGVDAGVAPGAAPTSASPQRGGSAFIVTRRPEPAAAPPPAEVPKPLDYAPIPAREAGRAWVRVFMSSACVAELEPGPMLARTGDLLPVPVGARSLTVKSACGGMVEVYWGKEEKPRISETFGKNQPLKLEFQ